MIPINPYLIIIVIIYFIVCVFSIIIIIIIIIIMAACYKCNGRKARCSRCSCASARCSCTSCRAPCCSSRASSSSQQLSAGIPLSSPPSTWSNSAPTVVVGQSSPPSLPPLASIFATRVFTLPHIPKAARDAWAGIISQELKAACSSLDAARWSRLFMLPKCILLSPTVSSRQDWRITLQLVRERLLLWSQGSFDELLNAVVEEADSPGPSGLRPSHLHEAAHCPSSTHSHEFVEALTVFLPDGLLW